MKGENKMKKLLKIALALLLTVGIVGCGSQSDSSDEKTLTVSATLDPHAKILEQAKPLLKEKYGIDLEVKVLDDYYIFNKALDTGDVDANYFQHRPFFDGDVEKNNYKIAEAGAIHIEPFGFYSKTVKSKDQIKDGAKVIISNSVADHGRILAILADAGLITIKDGVKVLDATVKDIASNPKNLEFTEIKPELLATSFNNGEGDLVVFEKTNLLENSQIGCFCVDNNDAMCKKFYKTDSGIIMLQPANDKYDPIAVTVENQCFRILGKLAIVISKR